MSDERLEIAEEGAAVVQSGLSVRQAHEIRTGCSPDDLCERCRKDLDLTPKGELG